MVLRGTADVLVRPKISRNGGPAQERVPRWPPSRSSIPRFSVLALLRIRGAYRYGASGIPQFSVLLRIVRIVVSGTTQNESALALTASFHKDDSEISV